MNIIEIFKAGKHTAMNGCILEFTNSDLENIAFSYNMLNTKAPLVYGHPVDDKPRIGTVDKLSMLNGTLFAEVSNLDSGLIQAVRDGRYRNVSASFYTKTSPQNPLKGTWFIKHVGILGAMQPSVKGMKPLEFSEIDKRVFLQY